MNELGTAVAAGLGASAAFGAGDFSGGFAAKRDPAVRVVALGHLLALVLYLLLALAVGEAAPRPIDVLWGALAGLFGVIGITALYRGLALGPMGTVVSLSAVLAAGVPVMAGLLLGERLSGGQFVGIGLALLGVILLSRVPAKGRGGLGLGVIAGLGFGLFFVFLAQAEPGSVFWPMVAARGASSSVMLFLAIRGPGLRPVATLSIVLSSLFDALGNVLFILAAQSGHLAEASVLSNVSPAVTALLAFLLLRERLRRTQWLGIGVTLVAVPLIAGQLW